VSVLVKAKFCRERENERKNIRERERETKNSFNLFLVVVFLRFIIFTFYLKNNNCFKNKNKSTKIWQAKFCMKRYF
jgi:hypothetical protein